MRPDPVMPKSPWSSPSFPVRAVVRVAFSLALCGALWGCSKPEPWERDEPEEALKVFLAALETRQLELAWEFLLPEDRAVLETHAAALAELGVERQPWQLLSPGHVVSSPSEYAAVRVAETRDEVTVVELVLHDERQIPVEMIRRDGRWYVDLPLESAAGPVPATAPTPAGETSR